MIIPGPQGYERTLLKMLEGLKGQIGKHEAPQRLTAEESSICSVAGGAKERGDISRT